MGASQEKLYLTMGGCGKAKVQRMRESLNSFDFGTARS